MQRPELSETALSGPYPACRQGRTDGVDPWYTTALPQRHSYETLYDWMDSENGYGRWHNCCHYKKTCKEMPGSWNCGLTTNPYNFTYEGIEDKIFYVTGIGPFDVPFYGMPTLFDRTSKTPVLPGGITELKDRSLDSMLPGMRPKLSLVNSIYELKDFKSLPTTVARVGTFFRTIYNDATVRKVLAKKARLTWNQLVRTSADVFLQWNFNIKPMQSDLVGIFSSLTNIRKQVQHLLENEGKRQVRHFAAPLTGYENVVDYYHALAWSAGFYSYAYGGVVQPDTYQWHVAQRAPMQFKRDYSYTRAMFYASMEFSYTLDQYVRDNAELYGLLDSLGVNFNPAIIWNAIPFSFVIDWVAGVSRWLDNYKIRLIEPRTSISNYCWAINVVRNTKTFLSQGTYSSTCPASSSQMADVVENLYYRFNDAPDFSGSLTRSGLSSREFILGGALAAAMATR